MRKSMKDLEQEAKTLVANEMILDPSSPCETIAQRILEACDREFIEVAWRAARGAALGPVSAGGAP